MGGKVSRRRYLVEEAGARESEGLVLFPFEAFAFFEPECDNVGR